MQAPEGEILVFSVPPEPADAENVRNSHREIFKLISRQHHVPRADTQDTMDTEEEKMNPGFLPPSPQIAGFVVRVDKRCASASRAFSIIKPLIRVIGDSFTLLIPESFRNTPELEAFRRMHSAVNIKVNG